VSTSVGQFSCQELVELVTDYLEGELTREDVARFERHLEPCSGCREYVAQMRATIELAGELTPADVTPEAEEELLRAFRDWKAS
jgi:predicted anti-sigma-YlaC factor YlaD